MGELSIDIKTNNAKIIFRNTLYQLLKESNKKSIVVLCIGTDRSTGDSLAPLVGHQLKSLSYRRLNVYGNLHEPVHAKNLVDTINTIKLKHKDSLIIAIDAALGRIDHIGQVTVGEGSIKAGTGVGKDLPPVGDIAISGVVNFSGFVEFMVLQNTRLSTVMDMSEFIADSLKYALGKIFDKTEEVIQ